MTCSKASFRINPLAGTFTKCCPLSPCSATSPVATHVQGTLLTAAKFKIEIEDTSKGRLALVLKSSRQDLFILIWMITGLCK